MQNDTSKKTPLSKIKEIGDKAMQAVIEDLKKQQMLSKPFDRSKPKGVK